MGRRRIKSITFNFSDYLGKSEKKLLGLPRKLSEIKRQIEDPETSESVRQLCIDELEKLRPEANHYDQRMREFLGLHWVASHFDPQLNKEDYLLENYEQSGQRRELIRVAIREFELTCTASTFQTWLDRALMPNCSTIFKIPSCNIQLAGYFSK